MTGCDGGIMRGKITNNGGVTPWKMRDRDAVSLQSGVVEWPLLTIYNPRCILENISICHGWEVAWPGAINSIILSSMTFTLVHLKKSKERCSIVNGHFIAYCLLHCKIQDVREVLPKVEWFPFQCLQVLWIVQKWRLPPWCNIGQWWS